MTKATRIVGIVVFAIMVLFAASAHRWREMFAWIIALGTWVMACVQQSRIDDEKRKIAKLQKQLGDAAESKLR